MEFVDDASHLSGVWRTSFGRDEFTNVGIMIRQQNRDISIWFNREIRTYDGKLRAYLRRNESNASDVEDIVQESYRRILDVKRSKEIRSPKGLLFKIAKNVINDRLRKKYRHQTISVGEIDQLDDYQSDTDVVEEVEKKNQILLLESAFNALPPKCRKIMILRTYENLSYKEIAERLDISVDTVETQLSRGLKKCRRYFERNSDES